MGVDLWVKRDDLTGFAGGGNKARKLEYILPIALDSGCDTIVTCGALQSNFIRQLGAACSVLGLRCAASVMDLPYDKAAGRPKRGILASDGGNVLLDRMLGVELDTSDDDDWLVLYGRMESLAQRLEGEGRKVYRIAIGGSSPYGAYGFYRAGLEVQAQQEEPFDWIVFASSSGSTQIGLTYAFRELSTNVLGICSDPEPEILEEFAQLGGGLAEILGIEPLCVADFHMKFDYVGDGYSAPYEAATRAIQIAARREGLFLDPVYSGKAFAGLLDMINKGEISGRILFWHTGGFPSIFAQH